MNGLFLMVGVGTLIGLVPRATAGETEIRDFQIYVDNNSAGSYRMKITPHDNGTISMTAEARVQVTFLLFKYTYTYKGTETWLGNRLMRLDSTCNDDGKYFTVSAEPEGNFLRVKTNSKERTIQPDVWTTTYWRLPLDRPRNGQVSLLDADTGRFISGKIQDLGASRIKVAGHEQVCTHYKITGDRIQVDAWYDAKERLVHQESLEDKHTTVLKLVNIGR
ncbi:MAG TPA: DUF6134 family protein [Gemmataceae bacterium]|nr:DUF6134 family protein [Gemmataceae bacterium]